MRGKDYLKVEMFESLVFIGVAFALITLLYVFGFVGIDTYGVFGGTFGIMVIAGMMSTYITFKLVMKKRRRKTKKKRRKR